ncbi:hypothetical protein FJZ55_06535, partial [Candidatus Woesearchaeota archaeon]|nr:hypothetical protein [Candidatus Woesearchaeota archaeon]
MKEIDMSKHLYEEALADVKKLKEVAEDNAKRALLDAVTPRIRDLIENQILRETGEEIELDSEDLLLDNPCDEEGCETYNNSLDLFSLPQTPGAEVQSQNVMATTPGTMISQPPMPKLPSSSVSEPANVSVMLGNNAPPSDAISEPDEEGKITLDLDSLRLDGTEEYELSMESAKMLGLLMNPHKNYKVFEEGLKKLGRQVHLLTNAGKIIKESKGYEKTISSLILQIENTYAYLQSQLNETTKKSSYESILENYYSTLKRLMEQKMKKTNRRLTETDVTLKLTGMPDEIDLDSIGVDLITGEEGEESSSDEGGDEDGDDLDFGEDDESGDGGGDEGGDELDLGDDEGGDMEETQSLKDNDVVEIDEGMLRREIARMKMIRESEEGTRPQSWGHGPGDVSDDFEDDDLGDPFSDVDLTVEADDQSDNEEDDQMVDEADDQQDSSQDPDDKKDLPESIRRRIRAEMKLQSEVKQKARQAKKKQQEAQKKGKQSKKMQEKQQAKKQSKKMQEAYNFYASKFNESVARTNKLKNRLLEAVRRRNTQNGDSKRLAENTLKLRNKLAETNLFNAKLLFTNKLLQNEVLTKRQKAEII